MVYEITCDIKCNCCIKQVFQQNTRVYHKVIMENNNNYCGPLFPYFSSQKARLYSFIDWPLSARQKPERLADAGFFYTGHGDRTMCFYCGGGLMDWEEQDVPLLEHMQHFNRCPYINAKFSNYKCSCYVDKCDWKLFK